MAHELLRPKQPMWWAPQLAVTLPCSRASLPRDARTRNHLHPTMLRTLALPFLATALLVSATNAQNFDLGQRGGGLPGTATWSLSGPVGSPYILLFHVIEQSTPIPTLGITLAIPPDFVDTSLAIPGFTGTLNGAGLASVTIPLPSDLEFAVKVFSLQAVGQDSSTYFTSNLVRMTMQPVGTFAEPLNQPLVPVIGGGVVAEAGGELLLVGGSGPIATRYKSRLEEWETAGASFGIGLFSQTTVLGDGRVLFTGGLDLSTGQPSAAAAIYDPATQVTTTLAMAQARAGHGASLMGNGRVLITGGSAAFSLTNPLGLFTSILNTTEVFNPTTNTFAAGPLMLEARAFHTSTSTTNGQVLIAGGISLIPIINLPTVSATAYRFNPTTNSFGLPAAFSGSRFMHTAVPLTNNNRVLLVGGATLDLSVFLTTGQLQDIIIATRTDCQVYTPSLFGFGTFATVAGMQEGRAGAAAAPLPNGGALIAGGFQLALDIPNGVFAFNPTNSADRFFANNTIAPTGNMAAARSFPFAINLPDGTVMVTGGGPLSAEIYQPN